MGVKDKLARLKEQLRAARASVKRTLNDPRVRVARARAARAVKTVRDFNHRWFGTHPTWAGNMPFLAWYAPVPPRERTIFGTTLVFWRGYPSTPGARLYRREQNLKAKILQERVEEFERRNPIVADMAQFLHPLAGTPQRSARAPKKKKNKKRKTKYPHLRWAKR